MIATISAINRSHLYYGAIIAGAAIAAVGAGVSAYGTSQNASAVADAAEMAAYLEGQLAKKQHAKLNTLISDKKDKLSNINTILDRFEGGAAFGSSDVLKNIREAQSEFAELGAGDFSGFQDQLDNILKATLANTYGSGAAEGTFTQLAADTVMGLRQGGLDSALRTGEFLSAESNRLLGAEFGILDQEFDRQYMIERNKVSGQTGQMMISAQQTGVATQAVGQAGQQIGGLVTGVGAYFNNMDMANQQLQIAQNVGQTGGQISTRPYSFTTPSITPVPPARTGTPSYFPNPSLPSNNTPSYFGQYGNGGEFGPYIPVYGNQGEAGPFRDSYWTENGIVTDDTSLLPPIGAVGTY